MPHQCIPVVPSLSVFEIEIGYFAFEFCFIRPWTLINLLILSEGKTPTKLLIRLLLLLFFNYSFFLKIWFTGWITHNYNNMLFTIFTIFTKHQVNFPWASPAASSTAKSAKSDCKADWVHLLFILFLHFSYKIGTYSVPSLINLFSKLEFIIFFPRLHA